MKKVTVLGVPEHFNFPWHLAMGEGAFANRGIDLRWQDIPEGTGKMAEMLQNNETDLAIVLTEGIIKSIVSGNEAKIVQGYIGSPLLWGIHVSGKSQFKAVEDLKSRRVAISRLGSGSHLMAYVHAREMGWEINDGHFEIIDTLEGAVSALTTGNADYFMWEHFTAKPLVDKGIFRRLGDCPTPWPCFVIAASERFVAENKKTLEHVLEVINLYTAEFKSIPSMDRTLANAYGQTVEDIRNWLSITRWSQEQIKNQVVDNVQNTFFNLKLISNRIDPNEILVKF